MGFLRTKCQCNVSLAATTEAGVVKYVNINPVQSIHFNIAMINLGTDLNRASSFPSISGSPFPLVSGRKNKLTVKGRERRKKQRM